MALSFAYDLLLVMALWWLAAALVTLAFGGAVAAGSAASYLLLVAGSAMHLGYFLYPWMLQKQTIGMRSWRLGLVAAEGGSLGFRPCLARALLAAATIPLLLIGWLWILYDPDRCTLYDRLCRTRLILLN